MQNFLDWMYAPNTWNDVAVYLAVFFVVIIIGMVLNRE